MRELCIRFMMSRESVGYELGATRQLRDRAKVAKDRKRARQKCGTIGESPRFSPDDGTLDVEARYTVWS